VIDVTFLVSLTQIQLARKVLLACDAWSAENMIAFLATTGTFIDEKWNLYKALIDFQCIYGMHSGENMAGSIFRMLENMHLVDKVSGYVS
jgi:hypothetical protein